MHSSAPACFEIITLKEALKYCTSRISQIPPLNKQNKHGLLRAPTLDKGDTLLSLHQNETEAFFLVITVDIWAFFTEKCKIREFWRKMKSKNNSLSHFEENFNQINITDFAEKSIIAHLYPSPP